MAVCFIAVGANFGICFYISLYYSLAQFEKKHSRAAVNEGVLGVGGFAGGMGLGYAAEKVGVATAFAWIPLGIMVAIALEGWLIWRGNPRRRG